MTLWAVAYESVMHKSAAQIILRNSHLHKNYTITRKGSFVERGKFIIYQQCNIYMRVGSTNCPRRSFWRPDFPPPLQPQVCNIYHVRRCISIIGALTHQICQLGKPWAAAVVRKPKQITLGLTPSHIKFCQQGTPRYTKVHQDTSSSVTKVHQGAPSFFCHQGTHGSGHQGRPHHAQIHQGRLEKVDYRL